MQCLHPGYFNVLLQVCVIDLLVSSSSSNNHHHHRIIIVIIIIWYQIWSEFESEVFCFVMWEWMCVWVFCVLSWVRENYIHCYCLFFDYYWCICLVLRFTIAHTAEEERIIVTIDCRLRFVCGEVEVCIFSSFCLFVCLFVCVCPIRSFGGSRRCVSVGSHGETSTGSLLRIYIYVCVLFREFQNVVSWWSEICSGCNPNSFFFLVIVVSFVDEFNRIQTKNRVKRNVVAIVVCLLFVIVVVGGGGSSLFQRKRNVFNKRCCCFVCVLFCCVVIAYLSMFSVVQCMLLFCYHFAVGKFLFQFWA